MARRIRWLGLVLVLCFAGVLAQLVNIQLREATGLNSASANPRISSKQYDNDRGLILAADGEVLAKSVKIPGAKAGEYEYARQYTTGALFSGVIGYSSHYYGTHGGVESTYDSYLSLHTRKATTLGQLLNPPGPTTDSVTLTVIPSLQLLAQQELAAVPDANQDGAVVVLEPKTGAVLADYSSPTYTNNALVTPDIANEEAAGQADFRTEDHEGFYPGYPMATFDTLAPGSTFKVVTSTAVYNLKPTLSGFTFPVAGCTTKGAIPDTTIQICNDATTPTAANPCGGTITQMLPESCDPGYAMLGLALGGTTLYKQATDFGFDSVPPVDLTPVSKSNFPVPSEFADTGSLGPGGVALSAFGQQTVTATALQNAMVAEGIADTGTVMTPHVMAEIRNATGGLVKSYTPTVYKQAASASAAQAVNKLMQSVVTTPKGTAYGVGFPKTEDVAVKTGTAQAGTGNENTTDWMIGFAPANDPKVAIAVLVPEQARSASGATIAGPIMKAMLAASLAAVTTTTSGSSGAGSAATDTDGTVDP
jgi:penicillin-binding protein A